MRDPFGFHDDGGRDGDGGDQPARRVPIAVRVLVAATLVVVVAAVAAAGPAGLLVALSAIAAVSALVLVLRTPGAPPSRRRRKPEPPLDDAPFRAYRQVAEALSWAAVSPRHYDLVTRPLLTRLAAARLADRHRVDLYAEPGAARAVLGDDVWPWVDPARETSRDSQPPGIGRDTLTRIVDRLEHL